MQSLHQTTLPMSDQSTNSAAWTAIAASWRESDTSFSVDVPALRAYVDAESRRMVWWFRLELCLTVIIVGVATAHLAQHPGVRAAIVAADAWLVSAVVWVFALHGRRGLWTASVSSTAVYLNVARRRASLRFRTAWLALILLAIQWLVVLLTPGPSDASQQVISLVATVAWLSWAVLAARRARRELRYIDSVRDQLETDVDH